MDKNLIPILAGVVAGGITFARMLKKSQESGCPS